MLKKHPNKEAIFGVLTLKKENRTAPIKSSINCSWFPYLCIKLSNWKSDTLLTHSVTAIIPEWRFGVLLFYEVKMYFLGEAFMNDSLTASGESSDEHWPCLLTQWETRQPIYQGKSWVIYKAKMKTDWYAAESQERANLGYDNISYFFTVIFSVWSLNNVNHSLILRKRCWFPEYHGDERRKLW